MSVFHEHEETGTSIPEDPRLKPTPDYGILGQGPESQSDPVRNHAKPRLATSGLKLRMVGAMIGGMAAALAVANSGGIGSVWGKFTGASGQRNFSQSGAVFSDKDLERQNPQKQAEILLERAVARSDGGSALTAAKIESRVDGWRGKIKWDAQLGDLSTAALNSSDRNVQDAAVEVQLAAYGLAKNEAVVDTLVRRARSSDHAQSDHAQKIWALWSLGLLGSRGVETERVVQELVSQLKTSGGGTDANATDGNSEDSRRWAVEGLALVGTTATIAPLLDAMHNDPSPTVRERAACSLAQSGLLSHEQRMIAVPQLIKYSGDSGLDAQTRGWAFQALNDITGQHLPNDSAAWQNWYQGSRAGN